MKKKKQLTEPVNIRMTKIVKAMIREMSEDEMGQENVSGWITMHARRSYKQFKKRNK